MPVKVSICIPTYNQIEFLKKNLESIVIQTYTDYEIIISDDSTTNAVEEFVKDFFSNKSKTCTFHRNEKPLGSPANWNKAVSMASGEYIKILHHDDWFTHKESLYEFVRTYEAVPNAGLIFCVTSILNLKTNTYSNNCPDEDFLSALKKDPKILFDLNKIGSPSAVMYKADTKVKFDERISYVVDVDFYKQLLEERPKFVFMDADMIVNTSHSDTQVTAASLNKKTQVGEYCYLYNKWYNGKFPNKKYRTFFKHLFANSKLESFKEIETFGYGKPKPEWIFKIIALQSKNV